MADHLRHRAAPLPWNWGGFEVALEVYGIQYIGAYLDGFTTVHEIPLILFGCITRVMLGKHGALSLHIYQLVIFSSRYYNNI